MLSKEKKKSSEYSLFWPCSLQYGHFHIQKFFTFCCSLCSLLLFFSSLQSFLSWSNSSLARCFQMGPTELTLPWTHPSLLSLFWPLTRSYFLSSHLQGHQFWSCHRPTSCPVSFMLQHTERGTSEALTNCCYVCSSLKFSNSYFKEKFLNYCASHSIWHYISHLPLYFLIILFKNKLYKYWHLEICSTQIQCILMIFPTKKRTK